MAKSWFQRLFARGQRPSARRAKPSKFTKSYLRVGYLEDRTVPATINVTGGVMTITSAAGANERIVVGTSGGNVFVFDESTSNFIANNVTGITQINVVGSTGNDRYNLAPAGATFGQQSGLVERPVQHGRRRRQRLPVRRRRRRHHHRRDRQRLDRRRRR